MCRPRCSSLHEKNVRSAFHTPPPYLKDLSSKPANRACESQDGDRIDPGPGPSAGEDREDQWDCKEVEAGEEEDAKEETKDVGERDESQKPPLRSTKKRPVSPAKEKSCVKRRTKRRRFSSPLSSDAETEMGDESDISSYKQYLVRWKQSWVDGGRLSAPCKTGGRRRYEVSVEPRATRNRLPLQFFWPTNAPYVANVDSWYRPTERRAPLPD